MVFILTYHNFLIQFKDLPHGFAYMDKDLPLRHMTNSGNWILTVGTYLYNGCKDMDYFLHFKRIRTNLQKGPKVRDQNAYSLKKNIFIFTCTIILVLPKTQKMRENKIKHVF